MVVLDHKNLKAKYDFLFYGLKRGRLNGNYMNEIALIASMSFFVFSIRFAKNEIRMFEFLISCVMLPSSNKYFICSNKELTVYQILNLCSIFYT